jgi:transposase
MGNQWHCPNPRPRIHQLVKSTDSAVMAVTNASASGNTLDAALQNLSERIELALAPHTHIVELLCTIPGVQAHAAQVLIAECGLDMTVFPTAGHLASWAGACPGHHESAGRRRSGRTRPG